MRIVIASDSYKGCLSSREVSEYASEAVSAVCPDCDVVGVPVADGGEGMVEALVDSLGGRLARATVSDPLGRPVVATYGIAGDLAIIESAAACGLYLLKPEERNPMTASTKGLGELILAAMNEGCHHFIVGLGGSATNDGGKGMVSVPGLVERAKGAEFTVACDVAIPYVGPNGTSRNFSPQKGATPEMVELLEARLIDYASQIKSSTGIDVSAIPGAGAAGGLGGAFRAFFNAELKRGVDMVLDILHFDDLIRGASLVITGEGCSDFQTVKGKTAYGVLKRAAALDIPVVLMSGAIRDEQILKEAGFNHFVPVTPVGMSLNMAMRSDIAGENIRRSLKLFLHDFLLL